MLQKISDRFKTGSLAAIMVAVLGFALAWTGKGASDQFSMSSGPESAATVDGVQISPDEARKAWQNLEAELSATGASLSEDETKRYQDETLERLVASQLLFERAREQGYRVPAIQLGEVIRSEPAFQLDGTYNETLALSRLAQIGLTAEQFRRDTQRRLEERSLQQAIGISEFVTPQEFGRRIALEDEQRRVSTLTFPRKDFVAWVDKSDLAVGRWFASNGARFRTDESVALQAAYLTVADLQARLPVSDDEARAEFAKSSDMYQSPERRKVRHILVADQKRAEQIIAELRRGADFEALAATASIDSGSAAKGGDLGLSEKSAFVPAFADVAFSLKPGVLGGPVKTEFGYHIIRVDSVEPGRSKTFDEVRVDLLESLKQRKAADRLAELEDEARRLVSGPGAEVAAVGSKLGMKVLSVDQFFRNIGGGDLSGDKALADAVFSDETLLQRRIGGPIPFKEEGFVVFKVTEHRKPRIPELAEVRDRVLEAYVADQADALALAKAQGVASRVVSGEFRMPAAVRFIDRRDPSEPEEIRKAAFSVPRPGQGRAEAAAVALPVGGAAVVMVDSVRPVAGTADAALRATRFQSVQLGTAVGLLQSYLNDLRNKAEVEKHPTVFAN
jgi:peptidyl-prolyl cis-trans isomerase D